MMSSGIFLLTVVIITIMGVQGKFPIIHGKSLDVGNVRLLKTLKNLHWTYICILQAIKNLIKMVQKFRNSP